MAETVSSPELHPPARESVLAGFTRGTWIGDVLASDLKPAGRAERQRVALMLEHAKRRSWRLLVILVEKDRLPLDIAAELLDLAPARAKEILRSLRRIAEVSRREEEQERRINRGLKREQQELFKDSIRIAPGVKR